MSKVLRLPKRRINTEVASMQAKSLDEQIANVFSQVIDEIGTLEDPQLRSMWIDAVQTFASTGDVDSLKLVTRYRRPVCDLDEFIFGKAYLNQRRQDIYPGVLDFLHAVDTDEYDEIVEKGALGIGKTTGANIGMARDIYKLSCMRNPQDTYGIANGTPIVFTIQSVRVTTARKVVFEELGRYIRNSPYFQTKFPFNPLIVSDMIFPEHNIRIMPVSSSGSAVISMNVIGGQLDELNFMQKTLKSKSSQADAQGSFDQALALYNTLASRRKSRFTKRANLPGALYLISSSRFPDDFTEKKALQATMKGGNDDRIYVFEGSQWDVKGRSNFSPEEFTVQIGNATFPSKVLAPGQRPDRDCQTIQVPMDWHEDFMRDVDGEIRNAAGLTTLSTHPFFTQRGKIAEAVELGKEHGYVNPMSLEEAELSIGLPDLDRLKVRTDVKAFRVAHIDLGYRGDACGLAVGHIAGHKVKEFKNEETGKLQTEILPVIAYDCILRIVRPLGGEIEFENVRKFLRRLNTKYKMNIEFVTFDGFQSVDSKQLLTKQGFKTGHTSVEKPEPWRTFRDALYDGRVLLPGHNFLNKELAEVETTLTQSNKEKIDHRPNGTKDVADAVVGVAAFLFRRRIAWQQISFRGGRTGLFLQGDKNKVKNIYAKADANVSANSGFGAPNVPGRATTLRRTIARRPIQRR